MHAHPIDGACHFLSHSSFYYYSHVPLHLLNNPQEALIRFLNVLEGDLSEFVRCDLPIPAQHFPSAAIQSYLAFRSCRPLLCTSRNVTDLGVRDRPFIKRNVLITTSPGVTSKGVKARGTP